MERVRPKKQLGQHFLTDVRLAEKVAQSLSGWFKICLVFCSVTKLTLTLSFLTEPSVSKYVLIAEPL